MGTGGYRRGGVPWWVLVWYRYRYRVRPGSVSGQAQYSVRPGYD